MAATLKPVARLGFFAAALTFALAVHTAPGHADPGNGNGKNHGAPGPVIGGGLPALLLIGGAAYLVFRRTRKAQG